MMEEAANLRIQLDNKHVENEELNAVRIQLERDLAEERQSSELWKLQWEDEMLERTKLDEEIASIKRDIDIVNNAKENENVGLKHSAETLLAEKEQLQQQLQIAYKNHQTELTALEKEKRSQTGQLSFEQEEQDKKEGEKFEVLSKLELPSFTVENIPSDLTVINTEESRKKRNSDWIKNISKDPYVYESLQIIEDLN